MIDPLTTAAPRELNPCLRLPAQPIRREISTCEGRCQGFMVLAGVFRECMYDGVLLVLVGEEEVHA